MDYSNELIIELASYYFYILGVCGILIVYIFKRHVWENDRCEEHNEKEHGKLREEILNLYKHD